MGRDVRDDTGSRVGGGTADVDGEGVCVGATSGTCGSVSGRTCSEVDYYIDWDGPGLGTTSGAKISGEGRTTLSVEGGSCGGDGGGYEGGDVPRGDGGVPP